MKELGGFNQCSTWNIWPFVAQDQELFLYGGIKQLLSNQRLVNLDRRCRLRCVIRRESNNIHKVVSEAVDNKAPKDYRTIKTGVPRGTLALNND
jgi:hypothetical protein